MRTQHTARVLQPVCIPVHGLSWPSVCMRVCGQARVKKIILSRFARGGFTNDTLRQSICSHTKALAVHFPALVSIAGALCEAPKAACQQAGGVLYRLLFTEFDGENKVPFQFSCCFDFSHTFFNKWRSLPNLCNCACFELSLTKAFYRTEVVGALMTHLGASVSSEKVRPQLNLERCV